MRYYSSSRKSPAVSLRQAVFNGLAPDGGLYIPQDVRRLPSAFFRNISEMSLNEIAYVIVNALFGDDIDSQVLKRISDEALTFDIPLKQIENDIFTLELYHGPTFAFKDVGARFLARILSHLNPSGSETINVLVATSGDSGGAVANGFYNVPGVEVFILYPKGKISAQQEAQFSGLGGNIHAVEVAGTFDDCQSLVRDAFCDRQLTVNTKLTSANSFNPVRLLSQTIYYFYAYSQIAKQKVLDPQGVVFSVPSGNLGNLCSGIFAKQMGLPVKRFVAANNANRVFHEYLQTGVYSPRASVYTKASAMDVGKPSNFARIIDLYRGNYEKVKAEIVGASYSDDEILEAIRDVFSNHGYMLDPHGATGYLALKHTLKPGETGIFLETAHPAKFKSTVEEALGQTIETPEKLRIPHGHKHKNTIPATYSAFRKYLLSNAKH